MSLDIKLLLIDTSTTCSTVLLPQYYDIVTRRYRKTTAIPGILSASTISLDLLPADIDAVLRS
jgi:hypothetical protein